MYMLSTERKGMVYADAQTEPVRRRFEAKFRVTPGCWIWTACRNTRGYGFFYAGGVQAIASRFAYMAYIGEIPDGLLVCHRCDNPSCVNPDHLFLGTHIDNNRDTSRKGRGAIGEKNPLAALTEEAVRQICASDEINRILAVRFGVAPSTIHQIRTGKTWAHITGISGANLKPQAPSGAKLTDKQVLEIFSDPRPGPEVAREYGVTKQTVGAIRRKETWKGLLQGVPA